METIKDASANEIRLEYDRPNRILCLVALTLLYYDFILTVPKEVERIWAGKLSWPSVLFFVNRYMSVLGHIPVLFEFFGVMPESRCRAYQQYHRILSVVIQGVVELLMIMRTYALYGRNRYVLGLLLGIATTGAVISLWVLIADRTEWPAGATGTIPLVGDCDLTLSVPEAHKLAIAWSTVLILDGVVFILTLARVLKIRRGWSGDYFQIMLRDSTIYFGVLFMCNVTNILAYILATPAFKGVSTSITNVMSSILMTRFMLDIRDPKLQESPRGLEITEAAIVSV